MRGVKRALAVNALTVHMVTQRQRKKPVNARLNIVQFCIDVFSCNARFEAIGSCFSIFPFVFSKTFSKKIKNG
jgi:hypothetical protein